MSLTVAITILCVSVLAKALTIENQNGIKWQPCPELNNNITILNGVQGAPFDCAKLSVPLDYTIPDSKLLELDLFRVNATKKPVLGTVLINFGGPGGTGAENLPAWGAQMAANIGYQWNLLSWDPRGTGKTIPFDCKIDYETGNSTTKRKRDAPRLPSANLTQYFLNGGWDFAGSLADVCYATMNETGQYISSAFVARDMLEIVDALNEDRLLRYYGWSYGTALGSYVAAMFPERVERVVLDANVNPHDYQAGHYGDFLIDADKTLGAFLEECLRNKPNCALAQYTNANKTEDLLGPFSVFLQPLAANASTGDEAWTMYLSAVQLIYQQLYFPDTWPTLAETITSVLNGTYDPAPASNSTVKPYNLGIWSSIGIRAADATWRTNSTEDYLPQVEYQETVSSFDAQYPSLWISARWRIPSKEQYTGNFNVKTRHPILYVNSEFDPATPLVNAYNGSASFEGSVVLPHSGYGHGIVVDPSACVAGYIQAYFANGTLPAPGTHCKPDKRPWNAGFGA